ncbi:metallophosphoesterase [Bremerella sp.]|uniref:metallophosphoesterase n=1 Tax=Bremerella sp. TaxID=2795602 RepID=UPI00391958F7
MTNHRTHDMTKPIQATSRLIAIGDIHGHHASLETLLELIQPTPDDTMVTLGDYVNRGPDTCRTLETLRRLKDSCRHIAILGNHDEMMLDSRNDEHAVGRWLYKGGDLTLE